MKSACISLCHSKVKQTNEFLESHPETERVTQYTIGGLFLIKWEQGERLTVYGTSMVL